jgi:C-terminal processing protease CtpA/Prc
MSKSYGVFRAVWTMLGDWRKGRLVRIAICTIVLFCGFVLPSQARPNDPIAQRQQRGSVYCGSIGVQVRPMTRAFADSLGMLEPHGAIFGQPQSGSPAAQAGIESGDVVTAINGQTLGRSRDFAAMISKRAPGSVIYLTTFRNGELMERSVTLGYSNCKLRSGAHRKRQNLKASLRSSRFLRGYRDNQLATGANWSV